MDKKIVIEKIKLDFDALAAWRDSTKDDLPICGYLSFYEACGALDVLKKHFSKDDQVCPIRNILCNFYTEQRIKNFIYNIWETYNIDINENGAFWKPGERRVQRKHPKKMKAHVRKSLNRALVDFCPGLEDEEDIEDNVLIIVKYEEVPDDGSTTENS